VSYRRSTHWAPLIAQQAERVALLEDVLEVIRGDISQRGGTPSSGQERRLERLTEELVNKQTFLALLQDNEARSREFEKSTGGPPVDPINPATRNAEDSGGPVRSMIEVW
jgi:hypothetical protein